MTTETESAIVERWFKGLFTERAVDRLDELVTPDFEARDAAGKLVLSGVPAFKEWLAWQLGTFAEGEWNVQDVITAGDKLVVRYSGRVAYHGGLLDIPTSNQRVTPAGILIFRLEGGKIREMWSSMNMLDLVLELGAVPRVRA